MRLFFLGKRELYFIDGFGAVAPLTEWVFGVEGGVDSSGLDPFFEELWPGVEIVGSEFLNGCVVFEASQLGRS